jgi:hypothetical protein
MTTRERTCASNINNDNINVYAVDLPFTEQSSTKNRFTSKIVLYFMKNDIL